MSFTMDDMLAIVKPHNDKLIAEGRAANAEHKLRQVRQAVTQWPRCCDLWQDGLGGMHCTECAQKTFAMLREVQEIIGVDKSGAALTEGRTP